MQGRAIKLSASRRLVVVRMRFSIGKSYGLRVQRQMNLGPLKKARMTQQSRTSSTVLFLKGYARFLPGRYLTYGALTSSSRHHTSMNTQ